ncbi:MAG: AAA family ATPase [Candidatus Limnocylindrales bacterium]
MAASTILLLETDPASQTVLTGVLGGVGYSVTTVSDPDEAFRRASEHNLLVIDVVAPPGDPLAVCREIRGTPALAAIPVLCISQDDEVEARIRFLEAGADDVMAKPFDARELEARVEALLLRFQRSRDLSPLLAGAASDRDRKTIAVFSPKGGVGTTTIAVNVASALAARGGGRTVIIDLDLQFGQVATHLNLAARQTLAELARDEQALREPELLHSYATRHDSGLEVFAAPASPELAELVTADHIAHLLPTAAAMYEHVVVDAGHTLDERTLNVFERADTVVFPVLPEFAALRALHVLIDYLTEAGTVAPKAVFVVNHIFAREMLTMRDVEGALGSKVTAEIPYDAVVYLKAVNEGIPVVRGAPRSSAADRLVKLSALVAGSASQSEATQPDRHQGLLGGLLHRA